LKSDGSFFHVGYDDLYAESGEKAMRTPEEGTAHVDYMYGRQVFDLDPLKPRR
jgi:hypothetical protein